MQVSTDDELEHSSEIRSPVDFARTAVVPLVKLDANATIKWKCAGKFDDHRPVPGAHAMLYVVPMARPIVTTAT